MTREGLNLANQISRKLGGGEGVFDRKLEGSPGNLLSWHCFVISLNTRQITAYSPCTAEIGQNASL